MTSTAFDDQFAVCTPEEEEAFREMQAQQDEALINKQRAQRAEDAAVKAMYQAMLPVQDGAGMDECAKAIYNAIRDGRIPGVVLGGGHE